MLDPTQILAELWTQRDLLWQELYPHIAGLRLLLQRQYNFSEREESGLSWNARCPNHKE